MNVVHVITRLIIGGAQENTLLICEGLAARGCRVTLIAGPTTGPEGSLVDRARRGAFDYVEVPPLVRRIDPLRDAAALLALRRLFRSLRPDVVHTHSSKAGIVGRLAAADAGVPRIIHTLHGMSFNRTQPAPVRALFAELERLCAGHTHRFISVADAMTRQALDAGIGEPGQFVTIYSGVDVAAFDPARHDPRAARARLGLPPDRIVVATIARLFRNKGYEQLIPAIASAAAAEPRLHFLWIGDGADRSRYEAELTRLGLRPRVTLTGLVRPEAIPELLSAADLLAHASLWEGLPRAVVQALLMERPVACFDLDGAPEVVLPGRTGVLVPPDDIAALSAAIIGLARDPKRRDVLGRAGRQGCRERFDHKKMVERIAVVYQE